MAMINHVVLFKLKEYPKTEKEAVLLKIKTALEALKDKIEQVRHIEVGLNYELEAKSYDLCLISHFDSVADLDVYRVHPEHLKVVSLIQETTVERAAVDYEF
ncbi:Dabb family protein [Sunxiuqinia rutila]|uniref:Dabb family protein n=1 Tax=Sunxiuqinia rutila TaxID=1397841 RepID=UPI003D364D6E